MIATFHPEHRFEFGHYHECGSHIAQSAMGVGTPGLVELDHEIENFGSVAVFEEIPQSFLDALADFEAGRFVDIETALTRDYPNSSRE